MVNTQQTCVMKNFLREMHKLNASLTINNEVDHN